MGRKLDTTILENRLYREFRTAFEEATGLHLDIAAFGEFRIADGAPHFCRLMDTNDATCQICQDTHASMQEAAREKPHTTECFAGMTSTTIPVKIKGEMVGFLSAGRVFLDSKHRANFEKLRRFAKRHGFNEEAVERALLSTASSDPERYRAAVNLAEIFARQFPDSIPTGPIAYPAVDRVLRLVREDLERDWTLAEAAKAANMNASYFSDVFRRKTGETFTQFLANQRVEKARALLESTSLRVSEIAFSCGFRTISQFNRRFKEVTGQSPSDIRASAGAA